MPNRKSAFNATSQEEMIVQYYHTFLTMHGVSAVKSTTISTNLGLNASPQTLASIIELTKY